MKGVDGRICAVIDTDLITPSQVDSLSVKEVVVLECELLLLGPVSLSCLVKSVKDVSDTSLELLIKNFILILVVLLTLLNLCHVE